MKERPILFGAPMVRALLAGTKTQTRRVVALPRKRESFVVLDYGNGWWPYESDDGESELCDDGMEHPYTCPYGQPGDRLWVRETWRTVAESDAIPPRDLTPAHRIWYEADEPHQRGFGKLRPSMFMPRWASRILLEVTAVRVERLQDISKADAEAEGIERDGSAWRHYTRPCRFACTDPRMSYQTLWELINGAGSWDANPFVWVVEFKRATDCALEGM